MFHLIWLWSSYKVGSNGYVVKKKKEMLQRMNGGSFFFLSSENEKETFMLFTPVFILLLLCMFQPRDFQCYTKPVWPCGENNVIYTVQQKNCQFLNNALTTSSEIMTTCVNDIQQTPPMMVL